jgi:hypothetical protein
MPIVWQIADAKNHTPYVVFDDVVPDGMLVLETDASGKWTPGIL